MKIDQLAKFIADFKTIISAIVSIVILTISLYTAYTSLITEIRDTQIMVLTPLVRDFERENEISSDVEYSEYIKNYTKLRALKIEKGIIPKEAPWKPIEQRIER